MTSNASAKLSNPSFSRPAESYFEEYRPELTSLSLAATADAHQKVTPAHLKRNAYLYVRQSTLRQVLEDTESTKPQYALRDRAVALGWTLDRIITIDSDLGQSGASAVDREGFQRLVAEVGVGKAGIVLGLEVSRLARNSSDWHRLLEICALTDTLILDEDGVYDPAHFNDRLLLGLKGTMSEAELHVLRARLQGGILNKARRGELKSPLPVGFAYDSEDRVILDPDKQVQQTIRFFFETFHRTGSGCGVVKAFRQQALLFPRRLKTGPHKGDLLWGELEHSQVLRVLHNPRYAGAFIYGRTRTRKKPDGNECWSKLPREQWVLVPGMHGGYIGWEEYQANQRRLQENAQAQGADRRRSPPHQGPALLQGIVLCGICGGRMSIRYHDRVGHLVPDYVCQRKAIQQGRPVCQRITGEHIDKAVSDILVQTMTPLTLEVALTVQRELQARLDDADRLRQKRVERARYEAELAQRRYMNVDPSNRPVADTLEADWNRKLRALAEAQEECERQRQADRVAIGEQQREAVMDLARDFQRVWDNPNTPDRERKRIVRLLLEDVTLVRREEIDVHIRFRGGVTQSFTLPLPLSVAQLRKTKPAVIAEIDHLLNTNTEREIAAILNEWGFRSGEGKRFDRSIIVRLRYAYDLKDRFSRLRAAGLMTMEEMAGSRTAVWAPLQRQGGMPL
jgi:DNA invertase Pin-like site-specific DNA recombinase